jgi:hypothetical protein
MLALIRALIEQINKTQTDLRAKTALNPVAASVFGCEPTSS